MILSHRHRFIFFAIPKTGTHAIRFALRDHLGEADEEQVRLFVHKAMPYPEIARIGHGHISWQEISAVVGPEVLEACFKFTIVRNPWERFVSYCAFMHKNVDWFADDPQRAMMDVLTRPEPRAHIGFRPQHTFVCDEAGRIRVDFVGRHETMQASYEEICARIGLPTVTLQHLNTSVHGPWRDYYTADLRARVAELYARDIELFGYSFD